MLGAYHLQTEAEKGLSVGSWAELPGRYRAEVDEPWAIFGDDLLLAILAGDPVGCVALDESASEPQVKRLWVDPGSRGSGAGTALMAGAMRLASDRGHRSLGLSVWSWRADAIAVYRRIGFEVVDSWEERDELVCLRARL
ncbi:GNAT family N-acetyltransferase [Aeromicrobium endophyticum]|uniref:GNAT family N-acetyltransferase n=1 Tax=Aeromicrobium endophyticum TaxID=2292704 RepID=A0A371P583_9ACTN|nr:GNAT family N-acetyltransferase [Aeromicrobium endophyticum]